MVKTLLVCTVHFPLSILEKITILAPLLPPHVKYFFKPRSWRLAFWNRSVCCLRKKPCCVQREAETKTGGGQRRRGNKTSFSFSFFILFVSRFVMTLLYYRNSAPGKVLQHKVFTNQFYLLPK